ncbi:MAG: glycosyltransferase, partial [Marmoricola sp.]|nr:glycosyltransferase [Marmoricola sp.]
MAHDAVAPPWGHPLPGNRWDLLAEETAPPRTVSVVVTHFEQPDQLARTLAALGRQTVAPDEVVVVDDGSSEPPRVPAGVTLLRQEDLGFRAAAARHLGASHATGEVLVFLDADTAPEPGFLEAITRLPRLAPELLAVGRRRHAELSGADGSGDDGAGADAFGADRAGDGVAGADAFGADRA